MDAIGEEHGRHGQESGAFPELKDLGAGVSRKVRHTIATSDSVLLDGYTNPYNSTLVEIEICCPDER